MKIAKGTAEHRGLNLGDYKEPEASFQNVSANTWQVFFDGRVAGHAKHFYIYVDDRTEEARYIPSE